MQKIFFACALFVIYLSNSVAQDTSYARQIVDTLASDAFHGRGYTNDGLGKAMKYLESQFVVNGLSPMNGKSFIQELDYPVNTFPGKMSVTLDGKKLRPGVDFIVSPESRSLEGSFELTQGDSTHYINAKGKLIVSVVPKLTWSVSHQEADYTTIELLDSNVADNPKQIEVSVENDLLKKFRTGNICGKVTGSMSPDSFIIFTAHYDHLGEMGTEAYFPGANDNASGVSMLLGLAKWFKKNPQPYSVGFILFTGEEAGLMGSEFFTKNPVIPLKSVRFLINLDLNGTGIEGITVVNATEFKPEFQLLKSISEKDKLLASVNERGKAKNSDHYWFTEKGVPSFFIYTLGGIKAYHDVFDRAETLPMNEYADLHKLLREFVVGLQKK